MHNVRIDKAGWHILDTRMPYLEGSQPNTNRQWYSM